MHDLFPEEEVDAVVFHTTGEGGLRLEVALPRGFTGDPSDVLHCLVDFTHRVQDLLSAPE
jgi:hypothetical protein